jgi:hypothetical protein
MAHQPMDDFLRNYIHRDPWDPTGWGQLPYEPTEKDRWSNWEWDKVKQDDNHWQDYTYNNEYGDEVHDRRLVDETERHFYDDRQKMIDEYDTAVHWQNTRLRQPYYEFQKKRIEQNGLQNVVLTPQITGNLISLRVDFPPQFTHLLNARGLQEKHATNAGFHISLSYRREVDQNPEHRENINNFLRKYFGLENGLDDIGTRLGMTKNFPHVRVNKNGIYNLEGNTEFDEDLRELVLEGTAKHEAHISLD